MTNLEWRSPYTLTPYIHNPKTHPSEQIDKIASAIREFGWDVPIVATSDGMIIKGHGRLLAAKKLNLEEVPVIIRDDLNEAQIKASRLADNKVSESEWLPEELKLEIESLQGHNFDLDLTGFTPSEISELLNTHLEDEEPPQREESNYEEDIKEDWSIVVECSDEPSQTKLLERLMTEGYECRALM